ncbi:hypothetical protein ACFY0N_00700 [Streptomyces vinaceus]|uniref:hypothetical protein n=1 Tax=Streptomyces vinaceus TaxID=1960 RepID=UPI0036CE052A
MDETTREKLDRLAALKREADQLTEELAQSGVRGVRSALAAVLGVSTEALRLRYGPTRSV